uniref:Serpentine receptor class gamma n=1 Tax=Strongyloides papillosus TaxID=174720 RepID=A0A0N5CBJ7_STREA
MSEILYTDGYKNTSNSIGNAINYIFVGWSYIIISFIAIVLQILTFIAFFDSRIYYKSVAFKIIFSIGFTSIFQQIAHFISGFYIIYRCDNDNLFGNIVGSLLQSSYMTSIALNTLLSINRFDVLYSGEVLPTFNRKLFYKICYVIIYFYFMANVIFCNIKKFRLIFNINEYTWMFVKSDEGRSWGNVIESYCNYTLLTVSSILFAASIRKIIYLRSLTSIGNKVKYYDIKVFLHAIFNYLFVLVLEICWGNWGNLFYLHVLFVIMINYLYIFVCCSNTIFGVILIIEIRKGIKKLLTRHNKIQRTIIAFNQVNNL